MQRIVRIAVLAIFLGSSTVGGAESAQESPTPAATPAATQRLAPKVARLAHELGVSLDARAVIDPRVGLRQLLRSLDETVNRMDFAPEDLMMELVLRNFVAELHGFAAARGPWNDSVAVATSGVPETDRVAAALNGVVSILAERSPRGRAKARPEGTAVASVGTGSISGTINRDGTGFLLPDVVVRVFDSSGSYAGQDTTDATGTYAVTGLGTGRYFAVTQGSADFYIDEVYLDRICYNPWSCGVTLGTPIPVTDGVDTPGIDFGLEIGGYITGQVWEAVTYTGLTPVSVAAYDAHGMIAGTGVTRASDYKYITAGLPTGDYFVGAFDSTQLHVWEVHDNIPTAGSRKDVFTGTAVHIIADDLPVILNFELVLAGSIEGTVTEEGTGTPVASAYMQMYEGDGTLLRSLSATAMGEYAFGSLPSGSYFVTCNGYMYVIELWDNHPCLECDVTTGSPIVVTQPSPTTGIDFVLGKGGRILGTITASGSGAPLEWANAYVQDATGRIVDRGYTAADGSYATFGAAPTGSYFVQAVGPTGGYISEVYPNTPCLWCLPTIGTAVAVTAGEDTTGIDFSLDSGGQISGAATIEGWGDPLNDASVFVYDSGGNYIGGGWAYDGVYQTSALPTGTYFATATGWALGVGLQLELFDDLPCPYELCDPTTGTAIGVTAPDSTPNIDFDLPFGARITGVVEDAGGGFGLSGITVDIYDAGGSLVVYARSGTYGSYVTDGLANGTYYAVAEDNAGGGYASELYDGTPCDGCDVTTGTPIVISSTSNYEGVDFSLSVPSVCSGESHLDMTSTSPESGTETFEACETITAGGTFGVQATGVVDLRAGLKIILTNGFFVESGATVTFEIDPNLLP